MPSTTFTQSICVFLQGWNALPAPLSLRGLRGICLPRRAAQLRIVPYWNATAPNKKWPTKTPCWVFVPRFLLYGSDLAFSWQSNLGHCTHQCNASGRREPIAVFNLYSTYQRASNDECSYRTCGRFLGGRICKLALFVGLLEREREETWKRSTRMTCLCQCKIV